MNTVCENKKKQIDLLEEVGVKLPTLFQTGNSINQGIDPQQFLKMFGDIPFWLPLINILFDNLTTLICHVVRVSVVERPSQPWIRNNTSKNSERMCWMNFLFRSGLRKKSLRNQDGRKAFMDRSPGKPC